MSDAEPVDAVVIGAGFAGLYMVHRLREQGFSVQIMYYSFSFLPELEQERPLTERYPAQPGILRYLDTVATRSTCGFTMTGKVDGDGDRSADGRAA